jgi:hypothetical protein
MFERHAAALVRALALALTMLGVVAGPAVAAERYYDGTQARTVTPQADLRALFSHAGKAHAVQAQAAGAVAVAGVGDSLVGIYRLPKVAARSTAAPMAAPGSPVYREGDSPAGRLMALPGGVMVKFKPDWSRQRIDAWLAPRGLAVVRQLAMDGNWFLIDTPAGEASLRTANAVYETGEVLAASPNWWKQTAPR